jgi:transmembrane sensor
MVFGDSTNPADRAAIEAARWRLRLSERGIESTPEFERWLAKPANAAAWAHICAPLDFLAEHADVPELVKLRRAALEDANQAGGLRYRLLRDWRRIAAAAAAVLVLGIVTWTVLQRLGAPQDYATVLGERRVVTLADGSRVSLDSNSEVTVRYTSGARLLHLVRGQARFDVAHDVERPFSVLAGGQKVIATGTAFNIDLDESKVLVTLIEGHVVIVDERSPMGTLGLPELESRHRSVELTAGQQLAASAEGVPDVKPANIQRATAWLSGRLIIDDEPLSEVVAQVNRYSTTPIRIDDSTISSMRISGVFNTGDVAGVLDIVTQYLPVRAVRQTDGTIELEKGTRS